MALIPLLYFHSVLISLMFPSLILMLEFGTMKLTADVFRLILLRCIPLDVTPNWSSLSALIHLRIVLNGWHKSTAENINIVLHRKKTFTQLIFYIMNPENKKLVDKLNSDADLLAKDLKTYKLIILGGQDDRMSDERFFDLCNVVVSLTERLNQVKSTCRRIINASIDD